MQHRNLIKVFAQQTSTYSATQKGERYKEKTN